MEADQNQWNVLWLQIQRGNEGSFKEVFEQLFPYLCRVANRIVLDEDEAKDIVHDVFLSLWTKRTELSIQTSLKSYLHRSVINKSLNRLKQKSFQAQREEIPVDEATAMPNPQSQLELTEIKQALFAAIDRLPAKRRTIFVLRRFEKMSYQEIADQLEISPRTVEVQLAQARKNLKEWLLPMYKTLPIWLLWIYFGIRVFVDLVVQ